jgi:benzoyl-CoA reductase/2-hydroxyglutaryl-CoA dehydratase subunit BcrC/BadD/HgdB
LKKVGFTTSIPVEVLFAAGITPIDLNNIFISGTDPQSYIDKAEKDGFPRSTCAWIKGIYAGVLKLDDIDAIIGVVEGDCSNTKALNEVFTLKGIKSIPFSYPGTRDYHELKKEVDKLCRVFGVCLEDCKRIKIDLDGIRSKISYIDELTWKHHKATGFENHIYQVSCSDFNSDYREFDRMIDEKILEIEKRTPDPKKIRLGYIGVPPILSDLYDYIENFDAKVVYNEVQRQFTMADEIGNEDIVDVYRSFTYPYSVYGRIKDIKNSTSQRGIDGIIHYTQAFCFRGIEDIVIRKELGVPVLTIEGDRPGKIDARTKLRIESFIDMLKDSSQ